MKSENVFVAFLAIWSLAAAHGPHCANFVSDLEIPSSKYCGGIDGEQGIAVAMRKLFELIPLECMLDIFFDAIVMDKEVNEFFNYITGSEFRQMIIDVQNMQEFQDFMEYICVELKLDAYLYLNTLGELLGLPPVPRPPSAGGPFKRMRRSVSSISPAAFGGVRGLMDTLKGELSYEKMNDMWDYLVKTDPYVCQGFHKLSSPEFKAIATKVEYHPEFIRMVVKLRDFGIEIDDFIHNLKEFLWYSTHCQ